jgi:hypothetical protein
VLLLLYEIVSLLCDPCAGRGRGSVEQRTPLLTNNKEEDGASLGWARPTTPFPTTATMTRGKKVVRAGLRDLLRRTEGLLLPPVRAFRHLLRLRCEVRSTVIWLSIFLTLYLVKY